MSLLQEQAKDLFNVTLTDEQIQQFDRYLDELTDWNSRMNLTAIIEPSAVRVRHFLDSLSVVNVIDLHQGMGIIDIGSGAGFPGLPLAIAFPDVNVTLLESTGKKVKFLDHVIKTLDLKNVRTLNARAEDAGHISHHRAKYDLIVARAVARLPGLVEYMLPLARVGGHCIAMKGSTAEEEAKDAKRALSVLKGELLGVEMLQLPDVEHPHYLVVIEKSGQTPKQYPRSPGIPTRQPIP